MFNLSHILLLQIFNFFVFFLQKLNDKNEEETASFDDQLSLPLSSPTKSMGYLTEDMVPYTPNFNGKKKYFAQCELCSYNATNSCTMNAHMEKHQRMSTLECDQCDFKTIWHGTLASHQLSKCGTEPLKCKLCSFQTIHPSNLSRHQKIHGKEPTYGIDSVARYSRVSTLYLMIFMDN